MRGKWLLVSVLLLGLMLSVVVGLSMAQGTESVDGAAPQAPVGTGFTYQGRLNKGGSPYTGQCDFKFSLHDALSEGNEIGNTQTIAGVSVDAGLFTVVLNSGGEFGGNAFVGDARWLKIRVKCGGDADYTPLSPRQALTATPYALHSTTAPWNGLSGVPAGFSDNVDDDVLGGLSCANGQIATWSGAAWVCGDDGGDDGGTGFWSLTGNAGTNPATHFLGTTDAVSLTLAVSGTAALRLEPEATSPNLIGGYRGNSVSSGVMGATISGGGEGAWPNEVMADYGVVGGGNDNHVHSQYATIGGGARNRTNGEAATVAGGWGNSASGPHATVGGGEANTVQADYSTVGGGISNTVLAPWATLSGGISNTISANGHQATVGGGYDNVAHDPNATIGGGYGNDASGDSATIGGGFLNDASRDFATVGGGGYNTASGIGATVAGGGGRDWDDYWFITPNTASGGWSTVSGGRDNTASGGFSTVGGGVKNTASSPDATVAGGVNNTASGQYATVAGGGSNTASGYYATVAGGGSNTASGWYATVAGGTVNTVTGDWATVGGGTHITVTGASATVGGGWFNTASDDYATVGGGSVNTASGIWATVPGGHANAAEGQFSFAAGRRAKANHDGTFVWADSTSADLVSTADDQFLVRAAGGVGIGTNSPQADLHVAGDSAGWRPHLVISETGTDDYARLRFTNAGQDAYWGLVAGGANNQLNFYRSDNGNIMQMKPSDATDLLLMSNGARLTAGGAWTNASDRHLKADLAPVDAADLLHRVSSLPIATWHYTVEPESVRHIGPTAQDFYAAFGFGSDDRAITTVDADGVALAAIQGLYEQLQEQEARIQELEAENASQQQVLEDLSVRLAALEAAQPDGEAGP